MKPSKTFKPMLAPHESPQTYPNYFVDLQRRLPLFACPKLDGIRCLPRNDPELDFTSLDTYSKGKDRFVCKSKEFKDLPSIHVQRAFTKYQGLDGELVEGNVTDPGVYNRTQSYVMSEDKYSENLSFHVFDCTLEEYKEENFYERFLRTQKMVAEYNAQFKEKVYVVEHVLIDTLDELLEHEDKWLAEGYEGLMWRSPFSPYKWGRGTWKEGYNGKLKRFEDFEAMVVGFEEAFVNTNSLETDELGYAKRSKRKEGMVPAGTLGKLIIEWNGEEIPVSCGIMTHHERKLVWENRESYHGTYCIVRHFAHGQKVRPRHPRFHGWRKKGF